MLLVPAIVGPCILLTAACDSSVGPAGPTYVAGVVEAASWAAGASPYRVTDTVIIPKDGTLTIGPGVDVLFDVDVQFVVNGALHADGPNDHGGVGGIYLSGLGTRLGMHSSVISGNTASSDGGGVFNRGATATLVNCTIAGNTASRGGGAICSDYAMMALTNCILWAILRRRSYWRVAARPPPRSAI